MDEWFSRRGMLCGLIAAPVAACASAPERTMVQVNLQSATPPPPTGEPPADADGDVRASFDAVRRMLVDVMIDGDGPYRFVVDTGANRSVLSKEVAAALQLSTTGQALVHGIAGVMPSPTVVVRALAVSGPRRSPALRRCSRLS